MEEKDENDKKDEKDKSDENDKKGEGDDKDEKDKNKVLEKELISLPRKDKRLCSKCCRFPPSVFFILSTEFCERFTFYGLKAILILYFTNHIRMQTHNATALFHFFCCLCYFTPLFGGLLADSALGKYWTIVSLGIVYSLGSVLLTISTFAPLSVVIPLLALILIGVGTGGIKPCVCTLGADQFPPENVKMIDSFFSIFYFMINLGSMSGFFTPLMRSTVQCFNDDCYTLAFGVPTALMIIALSIFVAGSRMYVKKPVTENIFLKSLSCIWRATTNFFKLRKVTPKDSFLEYADDTFDIHFIRDVRRLLRILFLFIPIPVFWSLYEQQGSRWVLQGAHMDGYLFAHWIFLPDQMTSLNTILVLLMIPMFEGVVYPLLEHFKINFSYLRRMTLGLFFAGLAFLMTHYLQARIEARATPKLRSDQFRLHILSLEPCPVFATLKKHALVGPPVGDYVAMNTDIGTRSRIVKLKMPACTAIRTNETLYYDLHYDFAAGHKYTIAVYYSAKNGLGASCLTDAIKVTKQGKSQVRILSKEVEALKGVQFLLSSISVASAKNVPIQLSPDSDYSDEPIMVTSYADNVNRAFYEAILTPDKDQSERPINLKLLDIGNTEISSLILYKEEDAWKIAKVIEKRGDKVSLFWQIPQYVVITIAEVLFTISGYAFAYVEAPDSMKAIVNAIFLLTIALGDLVVVFVAEVRLVQKQSVEFLLFAGLCWITTIIFGFLAWLYVPRTEDAKEPVKIPVLGRSSLAETAGFIED